MAQLKKIEGQIQIKSNAVNIFNVYAHKLHMNYKSLCPNKVSKAELQGGTHHAIGSIIMWNYIAGGNCEISKTKTEMIDEKSLSIVYENIDGHIVTKLYKTFKTRIQFIPKNEAGSIVKVTFIYEKRNEDIPEAEMYLDFVLSLAKDIDVSLCKA